MDECVLLYMSMPLDPRSPSGPPVMNLVTSSSFLPSLCRMPLMKPSTDVVVMPKMSCGMPPMLGALPVVKPWTQTQTQTQTQTRT